MRKCIDECPVCIIIAIANCHIPIRFREIGDEIEAILADATCDK
jgi:hypothetical protein